VVFNKNWSQTRFLKIYSCCCCFNKYSVDQLLTVEVSSVAVYFVTVEYCDVVRCFFSCDMNALLWHECILRDDTLQCCSATSGVPFRCSGLLI